MFPLDHLQRRADAAKKGHAFILKGEPQLVTRGSYLKALPVDLLALNTLNFYGLPVPLCSSRGTQRPRTPGPVKTFFLALVSVSAQTS